ncbi:MULTISPECIES: PTS sugar transporter subunit IIA [Clostridia]|uniref:PTS sugar transporter subunit IIA n=1 Tax=Clostridia TaxID=186801 RepID=UPI000EA0D4D7|nr:MULTISPECIES: PTS sugar transporter subunit IIA [Clostridia]NBJ70365.1 PTS sugar transporter subunit IIA [Roseburia sp. 1XD42-34]RKI76361.1 PTS sugar transporter subunit IIA [Clostridium sp. 1xD42-85]
MISTALNVNTIRLNVSAKNWEDAARKAGDLLLKNKSINEEYIESMVQSVHEFGPYIVIAPGIALFHARPASNVHEICLSMLTLETPIEFGAGDKDPVDLIFALGAIDHDSHLQLMAGLMKVLQDTNLLEAIRKAKSVERVIELINGKLEE